MNAKEIRAKYTVQELHEAIIEKVNEFVIAGRGHISLDCLLDLRDADDDVSIREALDSI